MSSWKRVDTHGLTPIAWEEILLDWNVKLPKSTLIQVWRFRGRVAQVLERGNRAIVGPSTHWYLDGGHGSWVDPGPKKKDNPDVKPSFLDWCNPYMNWRQVCSYDPFEGIPAQHHHLVYSGEACLWAELTDSVHIRSLASCGQEPPQLLKVCGQGLTSLKLMNT
jgi:hexosaminidase